MRLVTLAGPAEHLGLVVDGRVASVAELNLGAPTTMTELLADTDGGLATLRVAADAFDPATGWPVDEVELAAPVPRPRQIVAVGRNYREHTDEQGADAPAAPMLFAKLPSSVAAPGAEIVWDPTLATLVDYEAELGVVIGRTLRNASPDEALDAVLGYTCVNDVTARDLQKGDGQWMRGKSLDTFCPFGPEIVTADEIPDPQALAISCTVNGEIRQSSDTSQMFFPVAEILSWCSRAFTLAPGDLVTTGTPGGVGMHRNPPALLADGDVVTVEIEGIGRLTNPCRTVR